MAQPPFKLTVDDSGFNQKIKDLAALTGRSMRDAFAWQGQLLCAELIKRTPPFSGKSIKRMLDARPPNALGSKPVLSDPEIESLSAKKVGERRVEKDVKRVIYGVRGATPDAKDQKNIQEWGVMQRCEGKDVIRVFATKSGRVYGVDSQRFAPDASQAQLAAVHNSARTKNGRVSMAGAKDKTIGRWVWLNLLITQKTKLDAYIRDTKKHVGEAKGGWGAGLISLGGRLNKSGWVGKHSDKAGRCTHNLNSVEAEKGDIRIQIQNRSHWANGGDQDRIVAKSIQGRASVMAKYMKGVVEKGWGKR